MSGSMSNTPAMASTNTDNVPEIPKQEREETEQPVNVDNLIKKTKEEYLPYFVKKFSNLKQNEIAELAFLKDDVKYVNTVQQLDYIDSILVAANKSKPFYKIIAEFDGVFFAFRKLLEILFQRTLVEEGYNEPHDRKKPTYTYMVTCVLMNATDDSRDFARKLCQEPGFLELLVHFAIEMKDKHQAQTQTTKTYCIWGAKVKTYQSCGDAVLEMTLGIFYNLSMYDENRQRLLKVGVLEACLPNLESHIDDSQQLALLCVAYLTDEKQSSEIFKAKEGLIQNLVTLLETAIRDEESRCYLGWHAAELAKGLGALSRNDTNKKQIIGCGAIDVLLLGANIQDEPELQKETMVVLWTLSFDDEAKTFLKKNDQAMELFDKIVSTVPKPICRKAAKGILWNLRDSEKHRPKKEPCQQPHIMISYQWDAQALVVKVRDRLKKAGYNVWMDVDKMKGSTLSAMAEAVENSVVVLMSTSRRYKESQNCRAEAEYAFLLKKEIIPLRMEAKYKPDGWLGIIQGAKKYYNMSDEAELRTNMKTLLEDLGCKGKLLDAETKEVIPLDEPDGMSLKNWDKTQVSKWMKRNGISGEKVCDMDGKQLHFLKQMLQRAPSYYYSFVERNIFTMMDEFSNFTALTNALEEL